MPTNLKKLLIKLGILFFGSAYLLASPAYAFAATLTLSPTTSNVNRGCSFTVNIELNTGTAQTDGTDAIINYDPTRLTPTTITNGNIYPDYPGNSIDTQNKKINVSGLASVSQAFSGTGTLATLNFTVPANAPTGITQLTFDFDPNDKAKTTDSNVVERGTVVDVLDSVTNASYTVGTGTCGTQSTPGAVVGTGGSGVVTTGTGPGGSKFTGGPGASGSGEPLLPDTALTGPTLVFTIVGTALTILGIIGLAVL